MESLILMIFTEMNTENAGAPNSRLASYKHGVKSNAVSWFKLIAPSSGLVAGPFLGTISISMQVSVLWALWPCG